MRVIISGDAAQQASQSSDVMRLHQLFAFAWTGRHRITFDPPDCLNAWLASLDPATRSCYENVIRQSARGAYPADIATIMIGFANLETWSDPLAHLSLANAITVLNESVGILLENRTNDWAFLRQIMRKEDRERLDRAVQERWAEPLHGGGSDLEKNLKARLTVASQALRTFVIFDSDRLHPDEWSDDWASHRIGTNPVSCRAFEWERLTKAHMPQRYWVLKRRFIESYMPRAALENHASDEIVDAFFRLSKPGRWYYNMKKGFLQDDKRDDAERRKELAFAANEADRKILGRGFGENLAEQFSKVTKEFNWDDDAREEADQIIPRLMRLL